MCVHSHRVVVAASSSDSVIEEDESLLNCKCLCVDTFIDLTIDMVFDGDLHDSLEIVKKQSACRSRPALRRNVQLIDTLLCLEMYVVTDDQRQIFEAPLLNVLQLLFVTILLHGKQKNTTLSRLCRMSAMHNKTLGMGMKGWRPLHY
jgi:hypothetical protein